MVSNKMKVLFRADASFQIGSGHVIRCITLAKALRERGAECRFVFRDHEGNLSEYARKQGFHVDLLPMTDDDETSSGRGMGVTPYGQWLGATQERDARETIQCLSGTSMDWVIVDHYGIDSQWESRLRHYTKRILVIDDLANRHHDCDVLLDQNLIKDFQCRYDALVPENCAKLLGPEYAILQSEYSDLHTRTPPRIGPVSRILVYFGAADVNNLTALTLEALGDPRFEAIDIDVVVNPQSPNYDKVCRVATGNSRIHIHEDLPSLAPLMMKADLAMGAAGATSWERCCLGLPSIVVTLADNQKAIASNLDFIGATRWIGKGGDVTPKDIQDAIMDSIRNDRWLKNCSETCERLVDGNGVARVTNYLTAITSGMISARRADKLDVSRFVSRLLELRVLSNRYVNNVPNNDTSINLLRKLRDDENCYLLVMELGSSTSVGYVLFEKDDGTWRVNAFIDLLSCAISTFVKDHKGVDAIFFEPFNSSINAAVVAEIEISDRSRASHPLSIAICTDRGSWINEHLGCLIFDWLFQGHRCSLSHDSKRLPLGDVCFFLSYSRIVDIETRNRFKHNLVVHASDLPKGRGWSPTSWMILAGERRIPVTLLEASDPVDSGAIIDQVFFDVASCDLVDDWRLKLATWSLELCRRFITEFPSSLKSARPQEGNATYYPKRQPKDSEIDINKPIVDQVGLFKICDNKCYPVYFVIDGHKFELHVVKSSDK
jgi:UDP-2,4-diacetamido-2,4,6-trideoxy-beta-L-altropyranose hydrolase